MVAEDVVVEYKGSKREDDFFEILHEEMFPYKKTESIKYLT